jgi:phosphatidylinositol kinase/protein kinase (PI-3  family)
MLVQAYGRELAEAYDWCQRYRQDKREANLHQAWDLYYHVFKRINKQLPSLTVLELQYVAPALVRAQVREILFRSCLILVPDYFASAMGRRGAVGCLLTFQWGFK